MSMTQNDNPKGGWRWWFLWALWVRTWIFLARWVLPRGSMDWVFERTRGFALWCAADSPNPRLRGIAAKEGYGRG
jgi:hypothetical protein